jgi:hypothetical protein
MLTGRSGPGCRRADADGRLRKRVHEYEVKLPHSMAEPCYIRPVMLYEFESFVSVCCLWDGKYVRHSETAQRSDLPKPQDDGTQASGISNST